MTSARHHGCNAGMNVHVRKAFRHPAMAGRHAGRIRRLAASIKASIATLHYTGVGYIFLL